MKMKMFAACRMRTFAQLISKEMGVQVVLRGRDVCVTYGPPRVIYLPNMEYASEEDVTSICGLCLHEAGHLIFTDFKVLEGIPNYLVKFLDNAIEDEYMERKLEGRFPGAREMLAGSIIEVCKRLYEKRDPKTGEVVEEGSLNIRDTTFLDEDGKKEVARRMREYGESFAKATRAPTDEPGILAAAQALKLDFNDPAVVEDVAKRLEIDRVARLWLLEQRRYDHPLYDWPTHPWRKVFTEETTPRAKNSTQVLEQAVRIIDRLGVKPCLPGDVRPVNEAKAKTKVAEEAREASRTASRALRDKEAERDEKADALKDESDEHQDVLDRQDEASEANEDKARAAKALAKERKKLKAAQSATRVTRKRLAEERKALRETRKEAKDAEGEAKDALEAREESLEKRIKDDEELLAKREADAEEKAQDEEAALSRSQEAREAAAKADEALKNAEAEYEQASKRIDGEVGEEFKEELKPLEEAASAAKDAADKAVEEANKVLEEMQKKDGEVEEQFEPGATAKFLKAVFDAFRGQETEEELEDALDDSPEGEGDGSGGGDPGNSSDKARKIVASMSGDEVVVARKYCAFTHENDRVDRITETPSAAVEYEKARAEYAKVIDETTQKLRRLYSPEKTRVKVNAEEGRLDPRMAYKIGLAKKGASVNLERVWKNVQVKKDPKVAVSMLLDCSGSMLSSGTGSKSSLRLGQETAACLSEVMRNLNIPHEIVGHTTLEGDNDKESFLQGMLRREEVSIRDVHNYSRIKPFQGYIFKGFEDKTPPVTVFSDFVLADNIDGEAVHWAVDRLGNRPEKTKICISISDGMPCCEMANTGELERHLFLACKQIEAREGEGVFLHGVGINCDRMTRFYKNSSVITDVTDLPKTVLGIVEHVLCKLVGSMG
jgi:cobalamin biosynthesis protein CobT